MFQEIIFNPWTNNPLDFLEKPLTTADGKAVRITADLLGFHLFVDDGHIGNTKCNVTLCSHLNKLQVGRSAP